jgi:hypothetical protein
MFGCLASIPAAFAAGPPVPNQRQIGLGFGTLVCMADILGKAALPGDPIELFGGQVIVEAISAVAPSSGATFTLDVRIHARPKFSEHTITFIDVDNSTTMNCGDTIVSVS